MDKHAKLKRYRTKDYSEQVAFPVEILGRDGVVRRYGFEASLRLYERRMRSAPARFLDEDIVAAEHGHCKSRIDQLRRSFFHRYGWVPDDGSPGPETVHDLLAGDITAFFMRVFREKGRLRTQFTELGQQPDGAVLWYFRARPEHGSMFLYVYEFTQGDPSAPVAFQHFVDSLQRSPETGGETECVVSTYQNSSCGLVMTGRAGEVEVLAATAPETAESPNLNPTPWEEVEELIERADYATALLRCRWLHHNYPWHRNAYAIGSMLAITLRRIEDAEGTAFLGVGYIPDDPMCHYYLGMARLHSGRSVEAEMSFDKALELEPRHTAARSMLVLSKVLGGRWHQVYRYLSGPFGGLESDRRSFERLASLVRRAGLFGLMMPIVVALCFAAVLKVGQLGMVFLAASVILTIGVGMFFHTRFAQVFASHIDEDPQQALARVLGRDDEVPHPLDS